MDNSKNPSTEPQANETTTAAVPVKEEAPAQTEEQTTETQEVADPTEYDAEGQVPAVASSSAAPEEVSPEQSEATDTTSAEIETESDESPETEEAPLTAPVTTSQPKTNKTLLLVAVTLILLGIAAGAYGLLSA